MSKADFVKKNAEEFAAQLITFKTEIGDYSVALELTPTQISGQAADADYMAYVVASQKIMVGGAQQWTGWRDLVRYGGEAPAEGAAVAPKLPAGVTAVDAGVEARFRALVRVIKAHPNYNAAMGEVLGIEGAEPEAPDMATLQPDINAKLNGTWVELDWGWGGHQKSLDLIELQVDRGSGFTLLAYDTVPGYIDTFLLPVAPTKWSYRAIYRVDDHPVGLWSKTAVITVGG